jgi:hypothetical protein
MSAVMPESMALLLEKYSPEQIAEVVDAVMKMRPATSQRAANASTAATTLVSAVTERKKRAKKSTTSKVTQSSSGSIAPTRPLNSWMAFRSKLNHRMRVRTKCSDHLTRLSLSHLQVIPAEGHLWLFDSHVAERPFQGQMEHPC